MTIVEFLLARIAEDEAAAHLCAEMFPPPWDVADRGWRVRIYASDVAIEDLSSDDEGAMTTRNPVVMEVEPDRHLDDPHWLSERVEHVARHDPARVLAECEAKRQIIYREQRSWFANREPQEFIYHGTGQMDELLKQADTMVLRDLASVYADHPDYDPAWRINDA